MERDVQQPAGDAALRARAIKRLRKQSDFWLHLMIYLAVNGMLVAVWAWIGFGFFWPIFPLVGWGIGVMANAWDAFGPDQVGEDRIRREMDRMRR